MPQTPFLEEENEGGSRYIVPEEELGNEEEKRKIRVMGQRREPKLRVEQVNLSEVVKFRGNYSGKMKV